MKLSRVLMAVMAFALLLGGMASPLNNANAQEASTFYGGFPYQVPPKGHLNSFIPDGIPNGIVIYQDLLEPSSAMFIWATGEYEGLLAESWGFESEDTYVVKLREGATWSDGSPVTSRDLVVTYALGRLRNFTDFTYVDTVTARDDLTVEFKLKRPSTLVERLILKTRIRAAATYGAIADKVEALLATGDNKKLYDEGTLRDTDEWKALITELTEFRPETLLSSGPYTLALSDVTDAQLLMRKNPNSIFADTAKFDQVVLFNGETESVTPLFLNKEMYYGTYAFPIATERSLEENGFRILRSPSYGGPSVYFNHAVHPFELPQVRRAFAYIIDREQAGLVSLGESGKAVQNMAGISDNLLPLWVDEATTAQLNKYELNLEKAAEELTSAGFKKEGDVWVDDQGNPMEYELTVPAEFADWVPAAESVTEQLNAFGIRITLRAIPNAQHLEDIQQGRFQLAIRLWGIGNPHPFYAYRNEFYALNEPGLEPGKKGMGYALTQTVDGTETDLAKLIADAGAGADIEAQKQAISQMALFFNQNLPIVPIFERYGNTPLLVEALEGVPDESDPIYQNGFTTDSYIVLWLLNGTIGPKQ